MEKKVWLVTGCSTGFGAELVKEISKRGDRVIGTVRKESQVAELEAHNPELITCVVLDVQNQNQIDACSKMIEEKFGRLDVLINNAGYGSLGPVEEVPEEEMIRQFDVNVYGAVRMIKMALPFMRTQRSGHIQNVTSIAGLNGFPGMGIYNASKFALEGIGESLAGDVRHLGIKVTNVAPGPFRTDWGGRSATYVEPKIEDYRESAHQRMENIASESGKQIGDPNKAALAMIALVDLENPPVHLVLGGPAYSIQRKKIERWTEELDQFEKLGRETDFTE